MLGCLLSVVLDPPPLLWAELAVVRLPTILMNDEDIAESHREKMGRNLRGETILVIYSMNFKGVVVFGPANPLEWNRLAAEVILNLQPSAAAIEESKSRGRLHFSMLHVAVYSHPYRTYVRGE